MVETSAVLASAEDRVVDEAVAALESRQHGYDQASSAAECRSYVRHLFGLVVQCVHEGHAEPVIASSRQVAADRFGAGLDIAGPATGGLRQQRLSRGPQGLRRKTPANLLGHLIPPNPRRDQLTGPP